MEHKRHKFTSSLGFVLTAAGSAVGLGNIWRFPYLAAKYGGGMFLLVYIILVLTFGYSLMVAENSIGRMTGRSGLSAFGQLSKKWEFLGLLVTLIPMIILPYYNVIGGWVVKYMLAYITGAHTAAAGDTFFTDMLANPVQLIAFQVIFTALNVAVILRGVQKGVEKVSTVLMPVLILLAVIIAVFSITLDGAMEGVKYFFIPSFEHFSIQSVLGAMGQMFYSLSLAMGIMIAYGSYMPKDSDLEKNVGRIEIFDTGIAILAGLMIIPAVFAFSHGDSAALQKGPGLMFVTLPKVFESMPASTVVGSMFFILVLFAALTSSISVMETVVASLCDRLHISRVKSTLITGIGCIAVGAFPALGYNVLSGVHIFRFDILDFMDFVTNSVLMPVAAFLTCIFVGYVLGLDKIAEEVTDGGKFKFKRQKLFNVMIRYIAPVLLVVILISSILEGVGVIKF